MSVFRDAIDARRSSVDARFCNGGHANAGYLMALLADAAARAAPGTDHDPVAVEAVFLRPLVPGPASLGVELLREGRATATARVSISQTGQLAVSGHVVTGSLPDDQPQWTEAPPGPIAAPADCPAPAPGLSAVAPYLDHVAVRLEPASAGVLTGEPSGRPSICGWMSLPDSPVLDPFFLVAAPDFFFPTIWQLASYVAPTTVSMSWHGRAHPAPSADEWARVDVSTAAVHGGWCDETTSCRDSTGRLLATARQLSRLPRDPGVS